MSLTQLTLNEGERLVHIPNLPNTYGILLQGKNRPQEAEDYLNTMRALWHRVMQEVDEGDLADAQMALDEAAERESFETFNLKKQWRILFDQDRVIFHLAGWSRDQWMKDLKTALRQDEARIIPLPKPDDQPTEMFHLPSMMNLWSESIEE